MQPNDTIFETPRLLLRKLTWQDYAPLCTILQDPEVMYAYEHAFSDSEVRQWLEKQLQRYQIYGFGLWAVILKETGQMVGQCGITMQQWDEKEVPEIGYLFCKDFWHKGYAAEAVSECKRYACQTLAMRQIYAIIRDTNLASQKVALRNGMAPCATLVKHYYGIEMPHIVYRADLSGK